MDMLRIASLRGPSAIGMIRMMYNVTLYDEPEELLPLMSAESVDFVALPSAMAEAVRNMGMDYRKAAGFVWGGLFVCGKDSSIKGIHDLRGKTIYVLAAGSPPETMLRRLMAGAGLDPDKDVTFCSDFPDHAGLAGAAAEGRIGLCILPEPFLSQAQENNPDLKVLLDMAQLWRKAEGCLPSVTSLFVRGSLADRDIDTVRSVVRSLEESCNRVKANPREAASLAVEAGVFGNAQAIERAIPRIGFNVVPSEEIKQTRI